jgi:DNA polymerase-3 subunit gamma/tau
MSYQVLARKWRPRSFREMVGQTHVLRALINALDNGRLHHAYLFTGTRGVGKTTIARIIAKCLNCETGVSSTPCGQCSVCREIDEGRFVDLIEVDAASRTKVEDTRELLDNVQYAPSRGRYKVYLIDEVHMLSSHSFNALLKTLEEPPPHVKFLLATTDPQKLPVTILSRCLQFSLKNMPPERVVEHLTHVLTAEQVPFEPEALWLLGRAADGSMRDAMSLTDQAIAFGEGKVLAADVRAMLGTLDHGQVYGVLEALLQGDARALLDAVRNLAEQGPDWNGVLAELLNVLHRVAIAQALPDAVDNGQGDREQVLTLAQALPAEDVQYYYQMGLVGRRDLPLAPDPRSGFEMVLLRMLAFRPADDEDAPRVSLKPLRVSQATAEPVETPVAAPERSADLAPSAPPGGTALGRAQRDAGSRQRAGAAGWPGRARGASGKRRRGRGCRR